MADDAQFTSLRHSLAQFDRYFLAAVIASITCSIALFAGPTGSQASYAVEPLPVHIPIPVAAVVLIMYGSTLALGLLCWQTLKNANSIISGMDPAARPAAKAVPSIARWSNITVQQAVPMVPPMIILVAGYFAYVEPALNSSSPKDNLQIWLGLFAAGLVLLITAAPFELVSTELKTLNSL